MFADCMYRIWVSGLDSGPYFVLILGVGDMTKILYHDNNIYHGIVIFFFFKFWLYIKIFDTIEFS